MELLLPAICQDSDFIAAEGIACKDYSNNVIVVDELYNALIKWNSVLKELRDNDKSACESFEAGMDAFPLGGYNDPPTACNHCEFLKRREFMLSTVSQFYTDNVMAALRVLAFRKDIEIKIKSALDAFFEMRGEVQKRYEASYDSVKYIVNGTHAYISVMEDLAEDLQNVVDAFKPFLRALRMVWVCSESHGKSHPGLFSSYLSKALRSLWARGDVHLGVALQLYSQGSDETTAYINAKQRILYIEELCVIWGERELEDNTLTVPIEFFEEQPQRLSMRSHEALHLVEELHEAMKNMGSQDAASYCILDEVRLGIRESLVTSDMGSFLESGNRWSEISGSIHSKLSDIKRTHLSQKEKHNNNAILSKGANQSPEKTSPSKQDATIVVATKALTTMLCIHVTVNPPLIVIIGPVKQSTLERLAEELPEACATQHLLSTRDPTPKFERKTLQPTLQQHLSNDPHVDVIYELSLKKMYVYEDAHFLVTILDIVEKEGGWVLRDGDAVVHDANKITHKLIFQRKHATTHV